MDTRGDRLRKAREKHFKSARQAAIALGVPITTYGSHERAQQPGGRDYSAEEAQAYAKRFGVRWEHLLMGTQTVTSPPPRTCPLVGYVAIGDRVHFFADDKIIRVPAVDGATNSTAALELRNNPDFDKWLAFFEDERLPLKPSLVGWTCVVALSDDTVYFRRIERARHRGWFHLVTKGGDAVTDVRPIWAAKVHTMRQR